MTTKRTGMVGQCDDQKVRDGGTVGRPRGQGRRDSVTTKRPGTAGQCDDQEGWAGEPERERALINR